ncbi:hypothetical protein TCAL_14337 [Tigriopus californicus]|uniref:TGF-beta propeptide domain-containing protein n=1 Tax=Tigriopus californicus TaxID=6832 RepID=A0A553NBY5_TIGCA|nr:uncharacterized protein LOC131888173 [Tigriopus californicus]TRY62951.1 hypothetical protein TCAL_14337 [Tigriopus californicus]
MRIPHICFHVAVLVSAFNLGGVVSAEDEIPELGTDNMQQDVLIPQHFFDAFRPKRDNIHFDSVTKRPSQSRDLYRLLRTLKRSDPSYESQHVRPISMRLQDDLEDLMSLDSYHAIIQTPQGPRRVPLAILHRLLNSKLPMVPH